MPLRKNGRMTKQECRMTKPKRRENRGIRLEISRDWSQRYNGCTSCNLNFLSHGFTQIETQIQRRRSLPHNTRSSARYAGRSTLRVFSVSRIEAGSRPRKPFGAHLWRSVFICGEENCRALMQRQCEPATKRTRRPAAAGRRVAYILLT